MNAYTATVPDPDELPINTRLLDGRLTVTARIGRGGSATVYLARTSAGRDVALKIIAREAATDHAARQRFRNEALFARYMVDHPRVVTPYEVGTIPELGDRQYMTMPFIKGRPLYMMAGDLEVREAVALMRDLALAVAEVHDRGIVHRDIKPANVLVGGEAGSRAPYLIDFGVAWTRHSSEVPVSGDLTAAHELPGTRHYMAPEQVLGSRPTPRFDVYALAITTLELLGGSLPLEELDPHEVAQRKCDPKLPSLVARNFVPGLPIELERAINAGLEREPERRTPTARRFAEHLTGVLAALDRSAQGPEPALVGPPQTENHAASEEAGPEYEATTTRLIVAIALLVLVLLGGVGLWVVLTDPLRAPTTVTEDKAAVGVTAAAATTTDALEPSTGAAQPAMSPKLDVPPLEPEPVAIPDLPSEAVAAPPKPAPPKPSPAPKPCDDPAPKAASAAKANDWRVVLRLTKSSRCWDNPGDRAWFRLRALTGLRRYAECVKFGTRAKAPGVARLVADCQKKLDEGSNH